jgi:hypothetical protein
VYSFLGVPFLYSVPSVHVVVNCALVSFPYSFCIVWVSGLPISGSPRNISRYSSVSDTVSTGAISDTDTVTICHDLRDTDTGEIQGCVSRLIC